MGTEVLIEKVVLAVETIQEKLRMMQFLPSPLPILGCCLHWVTVEQGFVKSHVVNEEWALKPRETGFWSKSPTF